MASRQQSSQLRHDERRYQVNVSFFSRLKARRATGFSKIRLSVPIREILQSRLFAIDRAVKKRDKIPKVLFCCYNEYSVKRKQSDYKIHRSKTSFEFVDMLEKGRKKKKSKLISMQMFLKINSTGTFERLLKNRSTTEIALDRPRNRDSVGKF